MQPGHRVGEEQGVGRVVRVGAHAELSVDDGFGAVGARAVVDACEHVGAVDGTGCEFGQAEYLAEHRVESVAETAEFGEGCLGGGPVGGHCVGPWGRLHEIGPAAGGGVGSGVEAFEEVGRRFLAE